MRYVSPLSASFRIISASIMCISISSLPRVSTKSYTADGCEARKSLPPQTIKDEVVSNILLKCSSFCELESVSAWLSVVSDVLIFLFCSVQLIAQVSNKKIKKLICKIFFISLWKAFQCYKRIQDDSFLYHYIYSIFYTSF